MAENQPVANPPTVDPNTTSADNPLTAKIDKIFSSAMEAISPAESVGKLLQLNKSEENGFTNAFANGSTVIINSDRLLFNSKKDQVFICGQDGVTITSPKGVHIDCEEDVHIFSATGEIYLGLPNKGKGIPGDQKAPTTKAEATKDYDFEPVVLGLKLANLLEDLIVVLRDMVVRTPAGDGYLSTEMMYNLECLQARLPEMLSTAVFVEGGSHDGVDPAPTQPVEVMTDIVVSSNAGDAGSTVTLSSTNTGTTPQNTQSPVATNNNPSTPANPSNPTIMKPVTQVDVTGATMSPQLFNTIQNSVAGNSDGTVKKP